MTDYTDLIERLRAPVPTVYDCKDAADALEAQARRIAELTGNREAWKGIQEGTARLLQEKEARIAELEAENEELKKAISKPWMGSARAAYLGDKE
jgi:septal ring factor EnvC (AmiA/AmiB activator)